MQDARVRTHSVATRGAAAHFLSQTPFSVLQVIGWNAHSLHWPVAALHTPYVAGWHSLLHSAKTRGGFVSSCSHFVVFQLQ